MILPRRQLPVYSPVRAAALRDGVFAALSRASEYETELARRLRAAYGADVVVLTDSGTSALVMALRLAVGEGGTVAFPGYSCVDLTAAAIRARIRVRLYDVDPKTLSADLDSLRSVLDEGVAAVLVAHLYGFPVDVDGVQELTAARGVRVIEDAAQGAGGSLRGRLLGSIGPLSILSFGRGKGITGGGGGALLIRDTTLTDAGMAAAGARGRASRGWRSLAALTALATIGRPEFYALPSSLPWLQLGEMVYHPAGEPRGMAPAAAAVVLDALDNADAELARRRENANQLIPMLPQTGMRVVRAVDGGAPGYLRLPAVAQGAPRTSPALGVLRGYPLTLAEQPELRPLLFGRPSIPGATHLRGSLVTLPTHSRVSGTDIEQLRRWLAGGAANVDASDTIVPCAE